MNSSEVAKLLGVSTSTVQRWVKQLNLPMERNERGHYTFSEDDIPILEKIRDQIHNGALLQEIAPYQAKSPRKGTVKAVEASPDIEKLMMMFSDMERRIDSKADSVTSYQLIQHRKEIEELQNQVAELAAAIEKMEPRQGTNEQVAESALFDNADIPSSPGKRKKKKKVFGTFFGF
ncbi:MerR family transcriptional regulator [Neobacillus notoginsengisoli]|uniref:Chromosome-anchoring protein RacA n=1 Tax=Neobacillus notoginsengisoli TaxID=1578198 RepID=A0A417YXB0_9BACI|nr:MerR family transcriptional regulator [Neobacillus notoginsengisoli]RHW42045.1 MerR family transcriptional regulator [Neobacillus notoginsengisoli]